MKKRRLSAIATLLAFLSSSLFAADTIGVGVPLPQTGTYVAAGDDYFKGIKMAIDELNESGGLLGKQLEIIRYDSKEFSAEVVMQGADYLASKNVASVHAGWAGWGQDVRAYGKYDAPFFADDGSQAAVDVFNEDREKYNNIYQLGDVDSRQANSMFRALMALPYEYPNKNVVIINTDDAWGVEIANALVDDFEKHGWNVAMHETVPFGTREWGSILTQIRRIKPSLIHVEIPSSMEVITFFRQFIRRPSNSIVSYGWSITPREVVDILGVSADGIIGEMPASIPIPEAPNPQAQAWLNRYFELYGHQVPAGSFATYTGVMAWADAVRNVGDAYDFEAVNKHLIEVGYEGLLGRITWDDEHVLRIQPSAPVSHYQVQGGELVTIFTDPPITPYKDYRFIVPRWIRQ
ncbi:MAG: ABC transporter substrate-binding protein [Proteobacteria bacterium]|nr:ABC transporter substrate-binding protein [Pseudomonadota bacterium]